MPKTFTRRVLAGTSALALVALATFGVGGAATAAVQDFGDIDIERFGSLTIHKFLHQTGSEVGDPSAPPAQGQFTDPVDGVTFTVYPILRGTDPATADPVDLLDPDGWEGIDDTLTPGPNCTAPAGFSLGSPLVMDPTAGGVSTITDLPLSLYLVCETDAPATIVDRAPAFLLTLPLPHENGWVYDVHAFPKNGETTITKTIEPQDGMGIGSVIKFPVSVDIPTMAETWTGFAVRDTLDARLAPVEPVAVSSVKIGGVDVDSAYYSVVTVDQQVTVAFTPAGIAWLNTGAGANTTITVVFEGVVESIGDGTISNEAEGWFNNPDYDPTTKPSIPSNEVESYWGDIVLKKIAAGTSNDTGLLNGAVFQVLEAADPYAADCSTAVPVTPETPISVNGATEFTSVNGIVTIAGLFVSDSVNAPIKNAQRCYVVKETVAPAGYVLPPNPYSPVTVTIGSSADVDITVPNTQQEVPELPLTGAAGQLILVSAGVATLGVVIGLVLLNRRRATSGR